MENSNEGVSPPPDGARLGPAGAYAGRVYGARGSLEPLQARLPPLPRRKAKKAVRNIVEQKEERLKAAQERQEANDLKKKARSEVRTPGAARGSGVRSKRSLSFRCSHWRRRRCLPMPCLGNGRSRVGGARPATPATAVPRTLGPAGGRGDGRGQFPGRRV